MHGTFKRKDWTSVILFLLATFVMILAGMAMLLALASCSSEVIRGGQNSPPDIKPMSRDAERQRIVDQGQEFCKKYNDDPACRGPKP